MITSTCPYLGLKEDPATALNFTSDGNYCHKVSPAVPIQRAHQTNYCLVAEHVRCPVFVKDERALMPGDAVSATHRMILVGRMFWGIIVPVMLVLIGTVAAAWWLSRDQVDSPGMAAHQKHIRKGAFVFEEPTSPVPVTGAEPTITPFQPIAGGSDNTPGVCGPPAGWVTYTVQPTDSIFLLSLIYGVSVENLQRANCLGENTIVRPGDVFYVPRPATPTPTITPTATRRPVSRPPTDTPWPASPPTQPPATATRPPTQAPPTATQPVIVVPATPTPPPPATPTTPPEPPTQPPPTQPLPPADTPVPPPTTAPDVPNPTTNPWDLLKTLIPTAFRGG